jgi:hypothetical protein
MACFGPPCSAPDVLREIITGSFTIDTDAPAGVLPQVNITLTRSGAGPGGIPSPITLLKGESEGLCCINAHDGSDDPSIEIPFTHSLADGTHADLENLVLFTVPSTDFFGMGEFSNGVTGGVTPISTPIPTPEPTSLALMGAALAFFLLGRQPKFTQLQR